MDAKCGDGHIWSGVEDCDDNNTDDADDCLNNCTFSRCGDGINQTSGDKIEQCDDGNNDNNDDCLNTCKRNTCGDGFVYAA